MSTFDMILFDNVSNTTVMLIFSFAEVSTYGNLYLRQNSHIISSVIKILGKSLLVPTKIITKYSEEITLYISCTHVSSALNECKSLKSKTNIIPCTSR